MKKKTTLFLFIPLALLLSAAAFVGMGLMDEDGLANRALFGPRTTHLKFSDLLPSTDPGVSGVFVRRENNSIYVGTGNVRYETIRKDQEPPVFVSSYDGPVVEVIIGHDTQIWCDVTLLRAPNQKPVDGFIQQYVEPVSDDRIGEDSFIRAWGEQQGDRFLAREVLVFYHAGNDSCLD